MLPLFDGNILDKQVASVLNMGAEKVILLSPTMNAGLLRYVDALKARNIDAEIVRDAGDLAQYASRQDDMLFLADGVFLGEKIEVSLTARRDELIYVVANADIYSGFERIDLNHRWLGIALFAAARLDEIARIPEDWDIGSALLRTAVQSDCERKLVADADMQTGAAPQLLDAGASASYAKRQLGNTHIPAQNFLDRYIVWPLMRKAIPLLWEAPDAKKYTCFAGLSCAVIALGLGLIAWPVAALVLLFIGALTLLLHSRITIFAFDHGKSRLTGPLFYLLGAGALTAIVVRSAQPDALLAELTLLAILCGLLWAVRYGPGNGALDWIKPDTVLTVCILLVAAVLGYFSAGLYIAALFCTAYFIIAQSRHFAPDS